MKLSRSNRLVTVLVALFSLLYMQLAVAAYACPELDPTRAQSAVMRGADGMPMANCDGIDPQSPSLCHAHSQAGKQSLDKAQSPSVQPFAAARILVEVVHLEQPLALGVALPSSFLLAASSAPPIAIRNCCFRI